MDYRKVIYRKYSSTHLNKEGLKTSSISAESRKKVYDNDFGVHLPEDKRSSVLEIGCGNGELMLWLRDKSYFDVKGIDLSPECVDNCREKKLNVEWQSAEAFLVDKRDAFDTIIAVDVLEHLTKDEAVIFLDLAHKALKNLGKLIIRTPNADALHPHFMYGDFSHELFLNNASAKQLFAAVGFHWLQVEPGFIVVNGFFKKTLHSFAKMLVSIRVKTMLFASGIPSRDLIYAPNLVLVAEKERK